MGWWFDLAGPQDITYGLSWDNVAPRLTRLNWKTKATFRANVYIWIARARLHEKDKKERTSYFVYFYKGEDKKMKKEEFTRLQDAIVIANNWSDTDGDRWIAEFDSPWIVSAIVR